MALNFGSIGYGVQMTVDISGRRGRERPVVPLTNPVVRIAQDERGFWSLSVKIGDGRAVRATRRESRRLYGGRSSLLNRSYQS